MDKNKRIFRTAGILLFAIGVVTGMVLFVFMNWAAFEAYFFFGYSAPSEKALSTLRCPLLLIRNEPGAASFHITNTTDRDLELLIRTEISNLGAARMERTTYPIAAGETLRISLPFNEDDVVFGNLLLVRVYIYGAYTLPSRSSTCGTIIMNVHGLSGNVLFALMLATSLAGMAAGWWLWIAGNRPFKTEGLIATRAMVIFSVLVPLGIAGGILQWWGLGLFSMVGCVLMILALAYYYIQRP